MCGLVKFTYVPHGVLRTCLREYSGPTVEIEVWEEWVLRLGPHSQDSDPVL